MMAVVRMVLAAGKELHGAAVHREAVAFDYRVVVGRMMKAVVGMVVESTESVLEMVTESYQAGAGKCMGSQVDQEEELARRAVSEHIAVQVAVSRTGDMETVADEAVQDTVGHRNDT
jgi:hypothetical protein